MYTLFLTPETVDLLGDNNSRQLLSWASCVQRSATASISDLHHMIAVEQDVYVAKGYLL
jgi:hypothetical protein